MSSPDGGAGDGNGNNDTIMEPEVLLNEELSNVSTNPKSNKRVRYDLQTKYQILKDVDTGMTYKEIMLKYDLPQKSNITEIKRRRSHIEAAFSKGLQPGRKSLKTGNKYNFFTGLPQKDGEQLPMASEEDSDEDSELVSYHDSIIRGSVRHSNEWIVAERPINGNPNSLPIGERVSLLTQVMRRHGDSGVEELDSGANPLMNDTDKAVEILTKLLASEEKNAKQAVSKSNKRPLSDFTDKDLDREIKELKIKKLRSELNEIEEKRNERKAKAKKRALEIREKEQKAKFYEKINSQFGKFLSAAEIIIATNEGHSSKGNEGRSPKPDEERNLLEEAFHETVK